MKKNTQIVATALALIMLLLSLSTAMIGCSQDKPVEEETTTATNNTGNDNSNPTQSGKTEYTVSIKRIGGLAVPNVTFVVYEGDDMVGYGQTDARGFCRAEQASCGYYPAFLRGTYGSYPARAR